MAYHVNNTYGKLAPDSVLNKKIKEIMRYTGGTPDIPLYIQTLLAYSASGVGSQQDLRNDLECDPFLNTALH